MCVTCVWQRISKMQEGEAGRISPAPPACSPPCPSCVGPRLVFAEHRSAGSSWPVGGVLQEWCLGISLRELFGGLRSPRSGSSALGLFSEQCCGPATCSACGRREQEKERHPLVPVWSWASYWMSLSPASSPVKNNNDMVVPSPWRDSGRESANTQDSDLHVIDPR